MSVKRREVGKISVGSILDVIKVELSWRMPIEANAGTEGS